MTNSMADDVREECAAHFEVEYCECIDQSDGCGAKLELTVVSPHFEKVPPLSRHRKINTLLKDNGMMDRIHALTIHAWTPSQWETKRGQIE
mmetsp:Transcript_12016/g.17398  ORF Transcript_12016/g.17398 Transcript_12016/m.17398 type:complete len:91 (+) Transcript_12016:92-364(+)